MKLWALFLLTLHLSLYGAPVSSGDLADRVFTNGAVYTVNPEQPWATAVAITDGRITYVGDDDGAAVFVGVETEVIDLAGRMLMPGFHDSHMHPMAAGTRFLRCQLYDLEWPDAVLDALRKCGAELEEGEWLQGVGLADEIFGHYSFDKSVLDEIAPNRGAVVTTHYAQNAWVNSTVLAMAGIDADTPDPTNGAIERDPGSGAPTGILRGDAAGLFWGLIPPPSEKNLRKALQLASEMANGFGITSANESALRPFLLPAFRAADAAGEMTLRVQGSLQWPDDGADHTDQMLRDRTPPGTRFRADVVKLFVDGSSLDGTASVLEPYLGKTGGNGRLRLEPDQLQAIVARLDALGFDIHMHVVGDRAVRLGLDAIQRAIAVNGPRDRRPQLAHVKLIHPDDIPRFAELGVTADFQILWAKTDAELESEIAALGPQRSRWLMPINSVWQTGARVVLGNDWISESMNPLFSIQIAVTRQPIDASDPPFLPRERITLAQALAAYTINGAWLARLENDTGSIEVGKAADLIVLERNLFDVDPRKLTEVKVLLTLLEGREVFRHARFDASD